MCVCTHVHMHILFAHFETGSCCVAQTILKLMCSSDPPASHSQSLDCRCVVLCWAALVFCPLVLSECHSFKDKGDTFADVVVCGLAISSM